MPKGWNNIGNFKNLPKNSKDAFALDSFECKCGQVHKVHRYVLNIDCSCGKYYAREEWTDFDKNFGEIKHAGYKQLNADNRNTSPGGTL